jgi:hypothetical protein
VNYLLVKLTGRGHRPPAKADADHRIVIGRRQFRGLDERFRVAVRAGRK